MRIIDPKQSLLCFASKMRWTPRKYRSVSVVSDEMELTE